MEHRDLNDLAVFAAIAQAGSITGAAKKMKLPKSNVSRRLSRLEDRLGVQ
ncbi:helix-turn-helix domain-containing protein [Phaeobacter inhibens]